MTPSSQEITQWLLTWSDGNQDALDRLIPAAEDVKLMTMVVNRAAEVNR